MQDENGIEYEDDWSTAPRYVPSPVAIGLVAAVAFVGLYYISTFSYLLFHSLAEFFSIGISFIIFGMAWNLRHFLRNNYLFLIGVGYLFVGVLDILHTLSYKGMGIAELEQYGANLATQLWIAARGTEAGTLLLAVLMPRRAWAEVPTLSGFAAFCGVMIAAIFFGLFPDCYVEGQGLTLFKQGAEVAVIALLVVAVILVLRQREQTDRTMRQFMIYALGASIAAEVCFTAYLGVYDFANLLGHLFKIVSFYFIYKAVIEYGLARPQAMMFRGR